MPDTSISRPISTSDLRQTLAHNLPEPSDDRRMAVWLLNEGATDDPAWIVKYLRVEQPHGDALYSVAAGTPEAVGSALLTYRGRQKIYRTFDALLRDLKSIGSCLKFELKIWDTDHGEAP